MLSDYWKNEIMTKVYVDADTEFYVGFSSTMPNEDGTNVSEPSGGNYARMKINGFTLSGDGYVTNTENITFNTSTAAWFSINNKASYYVIFDGNTSTAHVLGCGEFYTPMEIGENVSLTIAAGLLRISLYDAVAP